MTDDIKLNKKQVDVYCDRGVLAQWLRNFIGHIIVIEGPISAGKTTLGRSIEKLFGEFGVKCKFFKEYKNDTLLQHYIKNMKTEAYSFQIIMLRERFRIYQEAVKLAQRGYAIFMDRSLVGDLAFALMQIEKGFFTRQQCEVYFSLLQEGSVIDPSLTIYLDLSPELAFERFLKRADPAEIMPHQSHDTNSKPNRSASPLDVEIIQDYINLSKEQKPDIQVEDETSGGYDVAYFESLKQSYRRANEIINTTITYHDWSEDKPTHHYNGQDYLYKIQVVQFLYFVYEQLNTFELNQLL